MIQREGETEAQIKKFREIGSNIQKNVLFWGCGEREREREREREILEKKKTAVRGFVVHKRWK